MSRGVETTVAATVGGARPPATKERTVSKALLVIDLQNDYFPGGKFPLWNTEATLHNIALPALSTRVTVAPASEALQP